MAHPTTKRSGKTSPQPISQSEIQSVEDMENDIDAVTLGLRRRLQAGATVEPGKWLLSDDGSPIEQFATQTTGGSRCGLEILDSEDAAAHGYEVPGVRQWVQ
jgi:hypothetical protein